MKTLEDTTECHSASPSYLGDRGGHRTGALFSGDSRRPGFFLSLLVVVAQTTAAVSGRSVFTGCVFSLVFCFVKCATLLHYGILLGNLRVLLARRNWRYKAVAQRLCSQKDTPLLATEHSPPSPSTHGQWASQKKLPWNKEVTHFTTLLSQRLAFNQTQTGSLQI